jgi:hypothetical protein
LLAEGTGIMFSLGFISYILSCGTYANASLRSRDFSIDEVKQIETVLVENNLLWPIDWSPAIKRDPRYHGYDGVIDRLSKSKDKIEKAIERHALRRNSIFTSLPKNMVSGVNEITRLRICPP